MIKMWTIFLTALKATIKGAIAGGLTNLLGFAKQEEVEKWELGKCVKTVTIGAITGGLVGGSGLPISEIATKLATWINIPAIQPWIVEMAILTTIVIVADEIVKVVVRRTDLKRLWNAFKELVGKYF